MLRSLPVYLLLALTGCAALTSERPSSTDVVPGLPIVLMHGMAGFDTLAGISYFYEVASTLRQEGSTIATTVVDPLAGVERRGRQAALQIDRVLAETGARKVHIIAHSQGGLDARYLVSSLGYADRVASITTIATPHRGSAIADLFSRPALRPALAGVAGTAALLLSSRIDIEGQLADLSCAELSAFNRRNPNALGVRYYSYAGVTQASPLVDMRRVDVVNPLFWATHLVLLQADGPNDGLVSVRSAQWGVYLGALPADHLDEIGLPPAGQLAFDHLAFYRQLASFLHGRAAPPRFPPGGSLGGS